MTKAANSSPTQVGSLVLRQLGFSSSANPFRRSASPAIMHAMSRGFCLGLAVVLCASAVSAAEPPVDYDLQIRPILSDKCYRCHGPDAGSRQADMRLDRRDGIPDETLSPGKPDESEL